MNQLIQIFNSSVGRKLLMALTGLFLCIFLLEHLYGNMLLYFDDYEDGGKTINAFNEYSHSLVHNLLIRIVEFVLFGAIIFHIAQAIILYFKNAAARPVNYAVRKDSETSTWFSRNMLLTGAFIFFFIVSHLYKFFVPYRIVGLTETQSVSQIVKDAFANEWFSILYVLATLILSFHLNHGFQSAFQTLGLNDKKCSPLLKNIGTAFAILVFIGYASFPVIFYFNLLGR